VRLKGYELAKAIAGTTTHEAKIELPVLANSQDMPAMAG
jgi:methylthioribulose-1-phosphate dehydratase